MKARIWLEVELPDEPGLGQNAQTLANAVEMLSEHLVGQGAISIASALQKLTDDPDATGNGVDIPRLSPEE